MRKKTNRQAGFSLAEMLTVIGAAAILISLSLFINLGNYRGDAFRAERQTLVTVLQTARADALNNVDQQAHGVAIMPSDHPGSYVAFAGLSYASSTVASRLVVDMQYPANFSAGTPSEIVFSQLSGDASYEGDITMVDSERNITFNISINHEGRISI